MKFNIILGIVLAAVVIQQGESSPVLGSSIRDAIVKVLETANGILGKVSTDADNYFLQILTNHTQIQEWSVDIQVNVFGGIVQFGVDVFDAYKDYIFSKDPSAVETKILTCISDQGDALVASVRDAASQNGWCNNRLAANLTEAFEDVTRNLVDVSDELETDIESYSKCILGDDLCLTAFATKVVALVNKEAGTSGDTLVTALEDVVRVYKIMFGQDVPKCNNEYLFPIIEAGVKSAFTNLDSCINS